MTQTNNNQGVMRRLSLVLTCISLVFLAYPVHGYRQAPISWDAMLKASDMVMFAKVNSAMISDDGQLVIVLDDYEKMLKGRKPRAQIELRMYAWNNPVRVGNSGLFFLKRTEERHYAPVDPNLGVLELTLMVCDGASTFGYVPVARGELLRDIPESKKLPCDSEHHDVVIKVP